MKKNVAEIFGKKARVQTKAPIIDWPLPNQLMGIEIEVEVGNETVLPEQVAPYWRRERDGSLITPGNGEYVLQSPLKGESLNQAITDIFHGTTLERSATGSTHIHMDMMEEETTQEHVKVLTLIVFALEQALFNLADTGREWCGYTNKLMTAPDELISAVMNAKEEDDYRDLREICHDEHNIGRYYGLNLLALAKYGSLEFRYFPTCVSSEELVDWIKVVQSLKKAAIGIGTKDELFRVFNNEDLYEQFITTYFEPWRKVFMGAVPYFYAHQNLRKAATIASISKVKPLGEFDEAAVVDSKIFAKFIKNRKKIDRSAPYFLINRLQGSPPVGESRVGTVMFAHNQMYMAAASTWASFPFRGARSLTLDMKKKALATLNKLAPILANDNAARVEMRSVSQMMGWSMDNWVWFSRQLPIWLTHLTAEIESLQLRVNQIEQAPEEWFNLAPDHADPMPPEQEQRVRITNTPGPIRWAPRFDAAVARNIAPIQVDEETQRIRELVNRINEQDAQARFDTPTDSNE